MTSKPIRRRDFWRSNLPGAAAPALIGLACLGLAAWWYLDHSAFARRAVVATAVLEDIQRSAPVESEEGVPSYRFWGAARYPVDGRDVRSRVFLRGCRADRCGVLPKAGDVIAIAYDPQDVGRAVLAPGGRVSRAPTASMVTLAILGLGSLGVAGVVVFSVP